MTRDDIIRMAEEAGFDTLHNDVYVWGGQERLFNDLTEFATLVAAAEREACAKLCDGWLRADGGEDALASWCAAAIRARGEK